jgi:serine/threonine protein kinase
VRCKVGHLHARSRGNRIEAADFQCYDCSPSLQPQLFGPFRVLHQIGAGVLGPVFRAYDPDSDRLVAVKLFRLDAPPERIHQLIAELDKLIAAGLAHPSIARPVLAGMAGADAFLAQDYLAADSLDILTRDCGRLQLTAALNVAADIAAALEFASARGVVHGALNPRDVLINPEETRIVGLGVARALEAIGIATPVRRPYTAPERAPGSIWDGRADVFGLAALTHDLLWGRPIAATGWEAADALSELPGADLRQLREAFGRALSEDPAHRFATPQEFVDAVTQACAPDDVTQDFRLAVNEVEVEAEAMPVDLRLPLDAEEVPDLALEPVRLMPSFLEPLPVPLNDGERFIEPDRFTDVEVAEPAQPAAVLDIDAVSIEPEIVSEHDDVAGGLEGGDSAVVVPPAVPAPPDAALPPAFMTAQTQSGRSAVWPLALALLVGAGIGFGGGYGLGVREHRAAQPVAASAAPAPDPAPAVVETRPIVLPAAEPTPPARVVDPKTPAVTTTTATSTTGKRVAGRIVVRSTPAGADVAVDGRDYGHTPVAIYDLSTGAHHVRVSRNGYDAQERQVTITETRPTRAMTVSLSRVRSGSTAAKAATSTAAQGSTGALSVDSLPASAKVFVDGRAAGTTPVTIRDVAAGDHTIRLELDGYRGWASSIRVTPNEKNRVTASLEK